MCAVPCAVRCSARPLLNAVQHLSLTSLFLGSADPAPKRALVGLQLSQAHEVDVAWQHV